MLFLVKIYGDFNFGLTVLSQNDQRSTKQADRDSKLELILDKPRNTDMRPLKRKKFLGNSERMIINLIGKGVKILLSKEQSPV